ncbi:MAG: alpha/beta hydrolase [Moraxellaceae bacterium]
MNARSGMKGLAVLLLALTAQAGPAAAQNATEEKERPTFQPWHSASFKEEFRASSPEKTLADYLALEDRLFIELDEKVYREVDAREKSVVNRYWAGSLADPRTSTPDWSRTQILKTAKPRGGVLLIHGLSDSPYIMRGIATHLQQQGWYVVALRLPGHGTAPSALLKVKWQDWAAAVRLAARDLQNTVGADKPLVLGGFSTGGALAVEYALAQRQGEDIPKPAQLLLFSPAIGVSPLARLAGTVDMLSGIPGLRKLSWETLMPEYDPYKYNSFPVNAGAQIWKLTQRIDDQLTALNKKGGATGLPRILAFQSAADATVSTVAVINALYGRLPNEGHRLVLFDANRMGNERQILRPALFAGRQRLLDQPALPFDLEIVTNEKDDKPAVYSWLRPAGRVDVEHSPTSILWPRDLFALSHVAVPVPEDDPVYGATAPAKPGQRIWLGKAALYGERDMLLVPETALLRLRYNPFFSWMMQRVDAALEQTHPAAAAVTP